MESRGGRETRLALRTGLDGNRESEALMTVLITGGGGMIGSFAARALRAADRDVALYDLAFRPATLVGLEAVPWREGDATDQQQLFAAVRELDVTQIVHTAGALTPQAVADPYRATLINVHAVLNVLEATRQFGLRRLVFASSGRVYGPARAAAAASQQIGEESPFNPESAYGTAKIAGELLGKNYVDAYGIEFVALRFSSVYGPGTDYGRSGFRALRPLLEGPLNGRPPDPAPLFPGATEMVYVRDVARAVCLAAGAAALPHRAYNVTSGLAYSYDDMRRTVLRLVGLPAEDEAAGAPVETPRLMDTTRARTELGFTAQYDLESGLRDHLDWLRRMGYQDAWLMAQQGA
jgi:UDP-glucose 4-epimerase